MAEQKARPTARSEQDSATGACRASNVEVSDGDTVELDRFGGRPYAVEGAGDRFRLWPVTLRVTPTPIMVGVGALEAEIADGKARLVDDVVGEDTLVGGSLGRDWTPDRAVDFRSAGGR